MSLDAIHYTLKSLVNFTCEQLLYRSRADTAASGFPLFMGEPAHEWKEFRSEGGTIFSF